MVVVWPDHAKRSKDGAIRSVRQSLGDDALTIRLGTVIRKAVPCDERRCFVDEIFRLGQIHGVHGTGMDELPHSDLSNRLGDIGGSDHIRFMHPSVAIALYRDGGSQMDHRIATFKGRQERGRVEDIASAGLYAKAIDRGMPFAADQRADAMAGRQDSPDRVGADMACCTGYADLQDGPL